MEKIIYDGVDTGIYFVKNFERFLETRQDIDFKKLVHIKDTEEIAYLIYFKEDDVIVFYDNYPIEEHTTLTLFGHDKSNIGRVEEIINKENEKALTEK